MKIHLSFTDIEEYVKVCYNINVKINFIEKNKIFINYFFNIDIMVKEVRDYSILLGYDLNWAANMLAKSAKFMTNDSLDENILQWDTTKKEIKLNLMKISALDDFLSVFRITEFSFEDNLLIIELSI